MQIQEGIAPCKPRIIAVTKYFDEEAIITAFDAGLRDFGESRVIEASAKIANLPSKVRENSIFHLIGHLQSNKVKQAVQVFDYIHSVDSVKLAQSISQHSLEVGKVQKFLFKSIMQMKNKNLAFLKRKCLMFLNEFRTWKA